MSGSGSSDVDVFAAAPDAIVIVDDSGVITNVNAQAGDLFGFSPAELLGQTIEILLPERFREAHVAHRKAYTAQPCRRPMGLALELFGRGKSGDEFPVDIGLNYQRNAAGELRVLAFVRDASTRRRMEEDLRASEQAFRLLVEGVADHAIFMLDPSGLVVTWNPGAERIKSWSAAEIIGRHFSVFYLPEDVASGQPERDLERAAAEGRAQSDGWRVRAGGQRFWAETTLSAVRDDQGTLRGFAKVTRDRTESHQARARLESVGELNRAVLERRPDEDLLALVASRARAMVNASLVAAWAPSDLGDELIITYAEGDGRAALLTTRAAEDSIVTAAARSNRIESVRNLQTDLRVPGALVDAGMGSGVFVPLHSAGDTFGVLGVMLERGREPLQPYEIDLLQGFALQAAVSFAHAQARRELERLHLLSDRERIARDLHDNVIQRLYGVGLMLEATGHRPAAEMQERLQQAVDGIDDTIRSIRSSIFSLEVHSDDGHGLRSRVLEVVADAVSTLGFDPSVRFDGPVDALADDEITENLAAVLREALANVARHAQAATASVTVVADNGIVLIVDDDGVGAGSFVREGGHGVKNVSARAEALGGAATITARNPKGTRLEWRVPIRG